MQAAVFLAANTICMGLLLNPTPSHAADLRDFISNLYGGNGIRLQPIGNHDTHFLANDDPLFQLNNVIAANVVGAALTSSISSLSFDVQQGLPVSRRDSLGPIIGERADTLGAGSIDFGVAFIQVDYDQFDGSDLDNLQLNFSHIDVNNDGILGPTPDAPILEFEQDVVQVDLNAEIRQRFLLFSATYGLTPKLDIGAVVPYVEVRARAEAFAQVIDNSPSVDFHEFGPGAEDDPFSSSGGEESGFGDISLRAKYRFYDAAPGATAPDLALFSQVKLPTGEEDDLLGSGSTSVLGMLVASKQYGAIAPHANVGYEFVSGGSEEDRFRYAVGADLRVSGSVTLAADVFGRVYTDSDLLDDLHDIAIGAKWAPIDRGVLSATIIVPLNKESGLRPDFAWLVGFNMVF